MVTKYIFYKVIDQIILPSEMPIRTGFSALLSLIFQRTPKGLAIAFNHSIVASFA